MKNQHNDTIAAIATPFGEGGVGIVRLSGPKAISIAARIFRPTSHRDVRKLPSHTLHYGVVTKTKRIVDDGLLAVMRAPHSYTREDVVEIQSHGGIIPLQRVLRLAIDTGARLAEPGEFTRRAFINGRLDLAQAEAVNDLVRARTEAAYSIALGQFSGVLSERIRELREGVLKTLAKVEASIDFPSESRVVLGRSFQRIISRLRDKVEELVESAGKGRIIREGIRAVIIGRPNVGKSCLMNALLKQKRVIVTHLPGTTRDAVEEIVNIGGVSLKIADTAGMRKTRSLIEIQGVAQSQVYLDKADLVILVLDGSQELRREDIRIIELVKRKQKRVLAVINKVDLPCRLDEERVKKFFPARHIAQLSAKKMIGFPGFQRKFLAILGMKKTNGGDSLVISHLRHQLALEDAVQGLSAGLAACQEGFSAEFIAFDLWQAADALGGILGLGYKENLLDEIFQKFCIGK